MSEKRDTRRESPYTTIVVAAKEARRLNALRLRGGMVALADDKVTNEAMRRAFGGEVDFEIVERGTEMTDPAFVGVEDEVAVEAPADEPAEAPAEASGEAPAEPKEEPSVAD